MIQKNEKSCLIGLLDREYTELCPLNCGYEHCDPRHTGYGMREYYLIHYVESGTGTLFVGGRAYRVGKGQVFIIRPHENAKYIADEKEPWFYIWIAFTGKLASKIDKLKEPVFDMPYTAFSMIKNLENRQDTKEELATGALFMIFADLFEGKSRHPHYVRRTVDTVNSMYMNRLSVAEIADSLGLDRRYLARIFKASMGISIQEYIIKVRMEQAQRLLSRGTSVGVTAEMVGYTDPFNFSKMFKKYVGVSPGKYKKG